jgi:hypothetical protein
VIFPLRASSHTELASVEGMEAEAPIPSYPAILFPAVSTLAKCWPEPERPLRAGLVLPDIGRTRLPPGGRVTFSHTEQL